MQTNFKNKSRHCERSAAIRAVIILTMLLMTAAVMAGIVSLHAQTAVASENAGLLAAADSPVWDGAVATMYAGGSGTKDDPYQISTGGELAYFRQTFGNTGYNTSSVYYVLTKNIILNDTTDWENWKNASTTTLNKWSPIGITSIFKANFDGKNFRVIGIYINTTSQTQGLFGRVSGTVSNVGVEKSYIKGGQYTGGITGAIESGGIVSNCYNTANITGTDNGTGGVAGYLTGSSSMKNCYNAGTVTGGIQQTGGIAGQVTNSSISVCYNTGKIDSTGQYTGGIAGNVSGGSLLNCYNTGDISGDSNVGGIAGYSYNGGRMSNCYNAGNIDSTGQYTGGIAGTFEGGSLSYCYSIGSVTSTGSRFGGFLGYGSVNLTSCYFLKDAGINEHLPSGYDYYNTPKTVAQLEDKSTYVNWDFADTWYMPLSGSYPRLYAFHAHTGNGGDYTAPTCDNDGYTTYICTECESSYAETDADSALGHDYAWAATADPTTTEEGELTGTCSNDGSHTTTVTLPVLNDEDYTYSVTTAPDCTANGVGTYTRNDETYGTFSFDVTIAALGHSYQAGTPVPPVCEEDGYTTYTCSRCGDHYDDDFVDAFGHSYQAGTPLPPACTEDGYTAYTCTHCGDEYDGDIIDALGHDYQAGTTVPPACEEDGYTIYTCSRCGDSYHDDFISAPGHNYGNWTVTADPTIICAGVLTRTCLNDSSHTETQALPALNDTDYTYDEITTPTDSATGIGSYTWNDTTYGTVIIYVILDMTGHSFFKEVIIGATLRTSATCTEAATYWFSCDDEDCDNISSEFYFSYGNPLGHNYGNWTVTAVPTTLAGGALKGTCSHDISHTTTVVLPALNTTDYSYSVTAAAACTTTGVGTYILIATTYGTLSFDVTIAPTGHNYAAGTPVLPTCTENGYTTYTCSHCGDHYDADFVSATGHAYGAWEVITTPAIGAEGALTRICSNDSSHTETVSLPALNTTDYTYSVITAAKCTDTGIGRYTWKTTIYGTFHFDISTAVLGHIYTAGTPVEPTCTEDGYTTYTCSRCGDHYDGDILEALGHDLESHNAQAATCTEVGWDAYQTCKRNGCNHSTKVEIDALGHDLESHAAQAATCTEAGWNAYQTCKRNGCNHSTKVEIEALGHGYEDVVAAPTCTTDGFTTYTCSRCGDEYEDDEVDALGHDLESHNAQAATCTEVGWDAYQTCKRDSCNHSTKVEIDALGHDLESHNAQAATCTEVGWNAYQACKRSGCDHSTKVEIEALGHNYGNWAATTTPTTAAAGVITRVCSHNASHTETQALPELDTTNYTYSITKTATTEVAGESEYTWNVTTYGTFSFTVAIPKIPVHNVTDGADGTVNVGNEGGYTFTVNGDYTKFDRLEIGGTVLVKDEDYTVSAGSTIITLTKAGLSKLGAGSHNITVYFTDGATATTTLTINEKDGLSGGAIAGIVIGSVFVLSLGGFAIFWFVIKKKKFADLIKIFRKD